MGTFSVEELYGCSRAIYCQLTGTSLEDMAKRLEAEVEALKRAKALYSESYRDGGPSVSDSQRRLQDLITTIDRKINRKMDKIRSILKEMK